MMTIRSAMRPVLALSMVLAGTGVTVSSNVYASDAQVGRYSLLSAEPTEGQTDLLATTVTVHFPAQIQTVGEAVRYLLRRSGVCASRDARLFAAVPLQNENHSPLNGSFRTAAPAHGAMPAQA